MTLYMTSINMTRYKLVMCPVMYLITVMGNK